MKTTDRGEGEKMEQVMRHASDQVTHILSRQRHFGLPPAEHERNKAVSAEELRDWLAEYGHLRGLDEDFDFLIQSVQQAFETLQKPPAEGAS